MIMKLPVYFRQSWQIMLKDRQYSLIYIIGVALSMALSWMMRKASRRWAPW